MTLRPAQPLSAQRATSSSLFRTTGSCVRAEESLVVLIGNESARTPTSVACLEFGRAFPTAKFALLADYANSRGAADMGLLPDLLPGYPPGSRLRPRGRVQGARNSARPDLLEHVRRRASRHPLRPVRRRRQPRSARYSVDPAALSKHLPHRPGHVPHRDRRARRRYPPRRQSLRESPARSPTPTATSSWSPKPPTKSLAPAPTSSSSSASPTRWAPRSSKLVPFGKGLRADLGQTRGAAVRRSRPPRRLADGQQPRAAHSAPSTPSPSSTKSSASFPATSSSGSIFSPATTNTSRTARRFLVQIESFRKRPRASGQRRHLFTSGVLGSTSPPRSPNCCATSRAARTPSSTKIAAD